VLSVINQISDRGGNRDAAVGRVELFQLVLQLPRRPSHRTRITPGGLACHLLLVGICDFRPTAIEISGFDGTSFWTSTSSSTLAPIGRHRNHPLTPPQPIRETQRAQISRLGQPGFSLGFSLMAMASSLLSYPLASVTSGSVKSAGVTGGAAQPRLRLLRTHVLLHGKTEFEKL
jgi:hypothetical protein